MARKTNVSDVTDPAEIARRISELNDQRAVLLQQQQAQEAKEAAEVAAEQARRLESRARFAEGRTGKLRELGKAKRDAFDAFKTACVTPGADVFGAYLGFYAASADVVAEQNAQHAAKDAYHNAKVAPVIELVREANSIGYTFQPGRTAPAAVARWRELATVLRDEHGYSINVAGEPREIVLSPVHKRIERQYEAELRVPSFADAYQQALSEASFPSSFSVEFAEYDAE